MILSAFYFDPIPIYRHGVPHTEPRKPALGPNHTPSPYLWSVWAVVALIHVGISVLWKLVGRIGIDAVTWGVSRFFTVGILSLMRPGLDSSPRQCICRSGRMGRAGLIAQGSFSG